MDSLLRDIDRENGKMQSDIANLDRHYGNLREYVYRYIQQVTVEWAKLVLDHPKALLLVVETTRIVDEYGNSSYGGENEPIRLTGLSLANGEVWDQLVSPTYSKDVGGSEYHGLSLAELQEKPHLADAWPEIVGRLEGHHIIIFGADWASRALRSVVPSRVLESAFCLHNKLKEFYGEFYELSLERVLAYQGIDKKREELRDSRDRVLMLVQVVKNLAAGMEKQTQEDVDVSDDDHPF